MIFTTDPDADPFNVYNRWTPSADEASVLRAVNRRRDVFGFVTEVLEMRHKLAGRSANVDEPTWDGVRHLADIALMRLAATPVVARHFDLKREYLTDVAPLVATNALLPAMARAALAEDAKRLGITL